MYIIKPSSLPVQLADAASQREEAGQQFGAAHAMRELATRQAEELASVQAEVAEQVRIVLDSFPQCFLRWSSSSVANWPPKPLQHLLVSFSIEGTFSTERLPAQCLVLIALRSQPLSIHATKP